MTELPLQPAGRPYPPPDSFAQRAARLARSRPPRELGRIALREGAYAMTGRRIELELALAARRGRHVLVGPFLGEIGFELLYWLPLVRRVLARHRVPPERVTVLTRGGAGLWYRGLAAREIELYDLMAPAELRERLEERRAAAGDLKQLTVERLDLELLARARETAGAGAAALHPALMYTRLRAVYSGWSDRARLRRRAVYGPLPAPGPPPPGLPERYIVLKAYFSDCFPAVPANRAFLAELAGELALRTDVVVLATGLEFDDHEEWRATAGPRVHVLECLGLRDNLAVQTRAVAGASALVSTYGGFSYLGPFLGVPTTAFLSDETFNPVHLAVLRDSAAGAGFTLVRRGGPGSAAKVVEGL